LQDDDDGDDDDEGDDDIEENNDENRCDRCSLLQSSGCGLISKSENVDDVVVEDDDIDGSRSR